MSLSYIPVSEACLDSAFYQLPPELMQRLIMQKSKSLRLLTLDLSLQLLNKSTLDFCFSA